MGYINKKLFFVFLALLYFNGCTAQVEKVPDINYIFGKWKCVKQDYRGYQKFSLEQAEQIRHSILIFEKNNFFYEGVKFIEPCSFTNIKISKYDTSAYLGYSVEYVYLKKELAKVLVIEPVDEKGEGACFNECAIFFLKQDTLINICGGYTFYMLKDNNKNEAIRFNGSGDTTKELTLSGIEKSLTLSYEFFKEPDELIIYDQNEKEIFRTGMTVTTKAERETIKLKGVSKLIFKIRCKETNSKWRFSAETK